MNDQVPAPAVAPEQGGGAAKKLSYRLRLQQLTAEYGHFALRMHNVAAPLQKAMCMYALGLLSVLQGDRIPPDERQFVVRAGVCWNPGVSGRRDS